MMFADEPRFYADKQGIVINTSDDSVLIGRPTTEEHLGPGSYFTAKNDERRGNWTPRSPEKNARPRSATFKSRDINHTVTGGIIVDDLYVHQLSSSNDLPGPGYYTPKEKKSGKGFSFNSASEMSKVRKDMTLASCPVSSPKSPRITPNTATLRDGVLCYSHEQKTQAGGPGYYYNSESTLIKKSFNVRSSRKQPLKQATPLSPSSSPNKNFRSSAGFPVSPIKKQTTAYMTPEQSR